MVDILYIALVCVVMIALGPWIWRLGYRCCAYEGPTQIRAWKQYKVRPAWWTEADAEADAHAMDS